MNYTLKLIGTGLLLALTIGTGFLLSKVCYCRR
jgi:hypothetical protein